MCICNQLNIYEELIFLKAHFENDKYVKGYLRGEGNLDCFGVVVFFLNSKLCFKLQSIFALEPSMPTQHLLALLP